ncbi:MAG TPA: hypothetical protein VGW75_17730 [Solirubrobacteraceae bacterium]|jgi:hypothetical protein|nr:hypothetical protein [Solirubrobacteraceae bacterium]
MASHRTDRRQVGLRLIVSLDDEPEGDLPPSPISAPRRVGERREPVTFSVGPGMRALARAARDARVQLDLAVTVVIERHLAESRLAATLGDAAPAAVASLDARATRERAQMALGDSGAAYLRGLVGTPRGMPEGPLDDEALIAVPMRLLDVVRRDDAEHAALRVALDAALRWERAAALHGMTLSEWAAWEALAATGRA